MERVELDGAPDTKVSAPLPEARYHQARVTAVMTISTEEKGKRAVKVTAALAALAVPATILLATPALASASSGPYVDAHATGWSHPRVEPILISVGQGCAPQEHHLHYSSWGRFTAHGTSDDILFPPSCTPSSGTLYLGRPRSHNGLEWFTHMTMRSGQGTLRFRLNSRGDWAQR
jgi:hypothetical protein